MQFNEINHELVLFGVFNIVVIFALGLDLGILSKQTDHTMSFKKALHWTFIWIGLSLSFAAAIYFYDTDPIDPLAGRNRSLEFIAAYLLEKSLSVDNLFVFIMIFQKFRVTKDHQPDILKWGIIGAVLLRAIMILMGAALVAKFSSVLYFFGVFLIYTAIKMFLHKDEPEEDFKPEETTAYKLMKKFLPMSPNFDGSKFFTKIDGKIFVTPLFVVLIMIELSDVVFAFDSIPAVFSVSQNPFIVYTSNIFAILGLRALFFMIAGIMDLFHYLKLGVSVILLFVGVKMLYPLITKYSLGTEHHISIVVSLSVIIGLLSVSIIASLPNYFKNHHNKEVKP